ncbi:ubiquitin-conjugating enzyme/RWD-like protein [Russula vinacea]|nr:ubiquitin-conjugating enzyme/RWD-like protein [Russula vinacea]
MSDARLRRVNKEIADCKNDKSSKINIDLIDNSPFHLRGSFDGPQDTPYEGGHFAIDIMKFITKVYHPNVSSASGAICLDILKDAWSPVLTLKSTLISLQSLLCSPEPNDPQDAEDTARYWTHVYAGGPAPPSGKMGGSVRDEVAIAGLDRAHVTSLRLLTRSVQIDVLRRLNYRGANVAKISDDKVVEELLKA